MDQDQTDKDSLKVELTEANYALIKESLCCLICAELFDSPFTLECGHSYCQVCLHHWLNEKKSCPECRLPVSRKPCPSYTLQKLANLFKPLMEGQVTQTPNKDNGNTTTIWDKLFPNHNPRGYFRDESDDVARCTACLNELEPDGECINCNLHYELDENDVQPIDVDSDSDINHHDEDEDSISESDLHFVVSDDQVEFESDVDDGLSDDFSSDMDDHMAPHVLHSHYGGMEDFSDEEEEDDDVDHFGHDIQFSGDEHEDMDDFNDEHQDMDQFSDEQEDMDQFSDEQDDIHDDDDDDDDESVNVISRRLGNQGLYQLKRKVYDIPDTSSSSSEEEDDDDRPDYAGLAGSSSTDNHQSNQPTTLLQPVQENKPNRTSRDTPPEDLIYDTDNEPMITSRNKRRKKQMVIISDTDEDDVQLKKVSQEPVTSSSSSSNTSKSITSSSTNKPAASKPIANSSDNGKKEKENKTEKGTKDKKKKKKDKAAKNKTKKDNNNNSATPAISTMNSAATDTTTTTTTKKKKVSGTTTDVPVNNKTDGDTTIKTKGKNKKNKHKKNKKNTIAS